MVCVAGAVTVHVIVPVKFAKQIRRRSPSPVGAAIVTVKAEDAVLAFSYVLAFDAAKVSEVVPLLTARPPDGVIYTGEDTLVEPVIVVPTMAVKEPAAAAVPPIAGGEARYAVKPAPETVELADRVVNAPAAGVVPPIAAGDAR